MCNSPCALVGYNSIIDPRATNPTPVRYDATTTNTGAANAQARLPVTVVAVFPVGVDVGVDVGVNVDVDGDVIVYQGTTVPSYVVVEKTG